MATNAGILVMSREKIVGVKSLGGGRWCTGFGLGGLPLAKSYGSGIDTTAAAQMRLSVLRRLQYCERGSRRLIASGRRSRVVKPGDGIARGTRRKYTTGGALLSRR